MTLKELLQDWEDQDICAYYLACCLGLTEYDATFKIFRETKHIYWSGNSLSKFLYKMLQEMTEIGMLEFDDDNGSYRWNNSSSLIEDITSHKPEP